MKNDLTHFDRLPDAAFITAAQLAGLLGVGLATVWRRASTDPKFPKLYRLGPKCTRANVGEVRRFMRHAREAVAQREAAEV